MPQAEVESPAEIRRDELGRPLAEDGYPLSGNARAKEVAIAGAVSISTVYKMIADGSLPSVPFGRARRVPWPVVRQMFLSSAPPGLKVCSA